MKFFDAIFKKKKEAETTANTSVSKSKEAQSLKELEGVLQKLQEACGVAGLKMSDYGILPEEFPKMAENASTAMKGLFLNDRRSPSREECVVIYQKAYR